MNQRVNHGACRHCGRPVLYLGAEFCSPACQAVVYPYQHRECVLCRKELVELTNDKQVCERCTAATEKLARTTCEQCGNPGVVDGLLALCGPCLTRLNDEDRQARGCPLCRGPLEPGQELCAKCDSKVSVDGRELLVLDTETELMKPGCMAPPLVCVGWATEETYGLLHHSESRNMIVHALEGDFLISGHYLAYDMTVFSAAWPEVIPLIFKAYEENRITDTLLREKLIDIATVGRTKYEYNLGAVARRRLGVEVDKKDEWRLRFGELRDMSIDQWPAGATQYAQKDPVVTLGIHQSQEKDRRWLTDQFRQARADFWIALMSAWGLHTDEKGVKEFARRTQQKYDGIAAELIATGLMRVKHTKKKATKLVVTTVHKNTKVAQQRMEEAWTRRKGDAKPDMTTKGISLNADNCERSGDELLKKYAEHSSIGTLISTFIPILESAMYEPLHASFDSLLVTGRTSSSPNVQNFPTEKGPRECFVPRPGFVYAIGDYSGMELRTWSQICIGLFGFSDMAVKLNQGFDCHTWSAANNMGLTYEQALAEYEQDPKGRIYFPRQACKAGNFAFPGGGGIETFRNYARSNYGVDLTKQQAIDTKQTWRDTWREAQLYLDWVGHQGESGSIMMEQAFVGRFRANCGYCDAANTLFQGLAADCAKNAGFLIAKACYSDPTSVLFGCRMVNFVHDEFILEIPEDGLMHERAMELARLMKLGADVFLPDVPAKVEPLLSRRWSKSSKPVHDSNGRLVPWEWKEAA